MIERSIHQQSKYNESISIDGVNSKTVITINENNEAPAQAKNTMLSSAAPNLESPRQANEDEDMASLIEESHLLEQSQFLAQ